MNISFQGIRTSGTYLKNHPAEASKMVGKLLLSTGLGYVAYELGRKTCRASAELGVMVAFNGPLGSYKEMTVLGIATAACLVSSVLLARNATRQGKPLPKVPEGQSER